MCLEGSILSAIMGLPSIGGGGLEPGKKLFPSRAVQSPKNRFEDSTRTKPARMSRNVPVENEPPLSATAPPKTAGTVTATKSLVLDSPSQLFSNDRGTEQRYPRRASTTKPAATRRVVAAKIFTVNIIEGA